jgi:hypothetical protein
VFAVKRNGEAAMTHGDGTEEDAVIAIGTWSGARPGAMALALATLCVGPARPGSTEPIPGSTGIRVTGDRLSLTLEATPVRDAITALARALSIEVSGAASIGDGLATLDLRDVPPERAIEQLLRGTSYALVYGGPGAAPRIAAIVVVPGGRSRGPSAPDAAGAVAARSDRLAPAAPAAPAGGRTVDGPGLGATATGRVARAPGPHGSSGSLVGLEPARRVLELRRAASQSDGVSPALAAELTVALDDPSEEVRAAALDVITRLSAPVPVEALTRLAHRDASAPLRRWALGLVAEQAGPAAAETLRGALGDPAASVRERARKLLDRLDPTQATSTGSSERRQRSPR